MSGGRLHTPHVDPAPILPYLQGSARDVANRYGLERSIVAKWRQGRCRMSFAVADRIACDLGLWPGNLWPDVFDLATQHTDPDLAATH